jgi:hypothetical protein
MRKKTTRRAQSPRSDKKRTQCARVDGWLSRTIERERERERERETERERERRASTFNLGESARIEIRFAFIFHRACLRPSGPGNQRARIHSWERK